MSYGLQVNFPTGRLLYADVLCEDFDGLLGLEGLRKLGRFERLVRCSEAAALLEIAHGYCGNTMPSLLVNPARDHILVISMGCNKNYERKPFPEGFERVGLVDTTVWWWSLVDASVAALLGRDVEGQGEFEVRPGVWDVTINFPFSDYVRERDETFGELRFKRAL